jgi:hypothetical protein
MIGLPLLLSYWNFDLHMRAFELSYMHVAGSSSCAVGVALCNRSHQQETMHRAARQRHIEGVRAQTLQRCCHLLLLQGGGL